MKSLKINVHHQLIDQFLRDLDQFPASATTSTIQYDTGKLIKILQEKEVLDICKVSKEDFDAAISVELVALLTNSATD